jgi:hypothetical protein
LLRASRREASAAVKALLEENGYHVSVDASEPNETEEALRAGVYGKSVGSEYETGEDGAE